MDPLDLSRHFAIVAGVSRYRERGLAPLAGAREDAIRFRDWLTESAGVLPRNLSYLEDPDIETIEEAFRALCAPAATTGYRGQRLYVYMAGHGVAQGVHEASLLAADGGPGAQDRHVPGWHWLSWFLQSGYFDEVVLFADCCRSSRGDWAVRQFPLGSITSADPRPLRWVRGYAVQFGGIAYEAQVGKKPRGVFTEALLHALKHARKADKDDPERWSVTAHSIREYLYNSPRLEDWRDYQAPSILAQDDVVFSTGRGEAPLDTRVVVSVEEGEVPVIRGGVRGPEPWPVEPGEDGGPFVARLPRGIYAASAGDRSRAFEVPGGAEVPPVAPGPRDYLVPTAARSVVLVGATSATEVYLVDSTFALRKRALQRLEVDVPPGVYKARFQIGSEVEDRLFEIRSGEHVEIRGRPLEVDAVAPLRGTRGVVDRHPAWSAAAQPEGEGAGVLSVLLRSDGEQPRPSQIQLTAQGESRPRALQWRQVPDWQVASLRLPAGTHVLAIVDGATRLCRAVPVLAGQHTALAIREVAGAEQAGDGHLGALLHGELLVAPFPILGDEAELLHQVVAQQVLGRSRALELPDRKDLGSLWPLTLLLCAHGVLESRRTRQPDPMDPPHLDGREREQVEDAYRLLQGTELAGRADVEALALALGPDASTGTVDLDIPPLLASTWRTLVTASLSGERLLGGLQALRMAEGMTASSLWLTWKDRGGEDAGGAVPTPRLDGAVQDLLDPELRPGAGMGLLPAWPQARDLQGLAQDRIDTLARGLQLPLPVIQVLVKRLTDARNVARRDRARRRIEALRRGEAKVCLVVLPDGVRVDPDRGQPIDFDAVMEDLVSDAAERAGLVAVRAPPTEANHSDEMLEAVVQADVLLVDETFSDALVQAATAAFGAIRRQARRPVPVVQIQAEGHQARSGLGASRTCAYRATYGTGLSFVDPEALPRALAAAARDITPPGDAELQRRPAWLRSLAKIEERLLELHGSATTVNELQAHGKEAEARAELQRALSAGPLRDESERVQLDTFLLCRAAQSGADMARCSEEMTEGLKRRPLVREQRALGLKWSGRPGALQEAARSLQEVLDEIGGNGETCGLLGGLFKKIWWEQERKKRGDGRESLEKAISLYRAGHVASPLDPYPGVNLLTLLAFKGSPEALEEHQRLWPLVEKAVAPRLRHRPNYWDLATMMELAANKPDRRICEWFLRRAVAAPHDLWQTNTTAINLDILCRSAAQAFKNVEDWLRPFAVALRANTAP